MRLPTITTTKSERTRQVEDVLTTNYLEFQYCFVDFLVEYLGDITRVFRGDLTQMLVLAVVGQSRIRMIRDALTTGLTAAEAAAIRSGVSASRVADLTSVPRQTVRRKLAQLRDKGWVEQYEDGTCVSTQWKSAHATKEKVAMSVTMDDSIKRWTAKRKAALVVEIIQGKTTVAEASRAYDLSPSEIEGWVDDAKRGMENALRANPLEIREQYEKQLKDLQEAYGEAMLELRARKKFQALMEREEGQ